MKKTIALIFTLLITLLANEAKSQTNVTIGNGSQCTVELNVWYVDLNTCAIAGGQTVTIPPLTKLTLPPVALGVYEYAVAEVGGGTVGPWFDISNPSSTCPMPQPSSMTITNSNCQPSFTATWTVFGNLGYIILN